jgi:hypothetical protein
MRKITSKTEQKKKQKRNQLIIGGILVLVMLTSVFGIIVNSFGSQENSKKQKFSEYTFIQNGGLWQTEFNNVQLAFSYLPNQSLENQIQIENSIKTLESYYAKPLYLYSEDYYSTNEIYNTLYPFVSRMQFACISEESCNSPDYPIKNCSENFILIRKSETPQIIQNQSCVYIQGPQQELQKITDEFLYQVFEIKD